MPLGHLNLLKTLSSASCNVVLHVSILTLIVRAFWTALTLIYPNFLERRKTVKSYYVNLENKAVEKCFLDVVVEDLVSDVHIKAYSHGSDVKYHT